MTNLGAGAVGGVRGNLQLPMAVTARKGHAASVRRQSRQRLRSERRYRRNWSVHFIDALYELQVPSRDCTPRALPRASRSGRHVGLRPPRNDKSGPQCHFNDSLYGRQCLPEIATGAKRPRNDNLGGIYHFNDSLYGRQVRRRARHASPLLFHTYRSSGQMSFSAEKTGRFSGKKFQKALAFRVFQCYNKDNL